MMKKLILIGIFCLVWQQSFAAYVNQEFELLLQKAKKGDAHSQAVLGAKYQRGEGVSPDFDEALKWFEKAAEQEEPLALYYMGYISLVGMYHGGQYGNPQELFAKALPGLEKQADRKDPRALLALATMYRNGMGVQQNTTKATEDIQKAAETGFPRALYALGMVYYSGAGVKQDYSKALEKFKKAKTSGIDEAAYQIANMYYNGQGVKKDIKKAQELYSQIQGYNMSAQSIDEEGDMIIPHLLPPRFSLMIEEGSCGECCLWSMANSKKVNCVSQIRINEYGGAPGRGLHGDELMPAMKKLGISCTDISKNFAKADEVTATNEYRSFLYDNVIEAVKKGHPVLIGVKVYPTRFPQWPYDHFLLAVGYNDTTNTLIVNDFTQRRRIPAASLINQREHGYSFLNDFNIAYALEITKY